jgi:hypothetical protein
MGIAPGGDVRIDPERFEVLDIGGAEVAVVQGRGAGGTQCGRDRL